MSHQFSAGSHPSSPGSAAKGTVRNAVSAPDYFLIQPQRVVELGTRVEL
jgi:hypothetical protein